MNKENGMTQMTEAEFNTYFVRKSDAPDIAEKAAAAFAAQPDLPYVEVDGVVVPNLALLDD